MEVLELFDPDLNQTFEIPVTAREMHLVRNGDYMLANKLLRKAQEVYNTELASQLENEDRDNHEDEDIDADLISNDSIVICTPEDSAVGTQGTLESETEVETNLESENFEWTKQTTKLFLELYMERKHHFRDPKMKKKIIWRDMKNIFLQKGHKGVNEDILDRKMRNMKRRYRTIKDNQQKTGSGRISWDYFERMEEIFVDDKTVNFGETLASSPILLSQQTLSTAMNKKSCVPFQQVLCSTQASTSNTSCVQQENFNSLNILPREVSPDISSIPATPKTKKALKSREVYSMRQKLKTLDETKVEELKKLRESVDENNRIQKERNDILMKLVNKKT